jgi:hypothetical protein
MTSIKRHGVWKSTAVAEGYLEDSLNNKIAISNKISNCQPSTSHQQNMAIEISDNQVCTSEGVKKKCEEVCENICEKNESFVMKSSGINEGNSGSKCTINIYFNNK